MASFWSMLKRDYHGTFHHMSAEHLHRYVNEFATRLNMRGKDTVDMMQRPLQDWWVGVRLTRHWWSTNNAIRHLWTL